MKNFFLCLAISLILMACSAKNNPKTVYIVRHAEKQLVESNDPELAVAGKARAVKLSQILDDEDIKHIFSTPYKRTMGTAVPTAEVSGVEIQTYDPTNHDALVKQLRELEGNILVVGHSNTVSQLANYFIGEAEKFKDLEDIEYDFIYEVSLGRNGESVIRKTIQDY